MPGESKDRIERIDSLPTNDELGIEKIPVATRYESRPKPTGRAVDLHPFDGLVVSETSDKK